MVEIKHLCLCLLFSSTHISVYKDTFAFCKDTKCVQGHAILMPGPATHIVRTSAVVCLAPQLSIRSNASARYHIFKDVVYSP